MCNACRIYGNQQENKCSCYQACNKYFPFLTVFGMNVGGLPWTEKNDPSLKDGFRNVMILCVAILLFLLLCVAFPYLYAHISAWRRRRALRRSWSINRKPFVRRTLLGGRFQPGSYVRV